MTSCSPQQAPLAATKPRAAKTPIMPLTPHPLKFADPDIRAWQVVGAAEIGSRRVCRMGSPAGAEARGTSISNKPGVLGGLRWCSLPNEGALPARGGWLSRRGALQRVAGSPPVNPPGGEGGAANHASKRIALHSIRRTPVTMAKTIATKGRHPETILGPFLHAGGRAKTRGPSRPRRFELSTSTPVEENPPSVLARDYEGNLSLLNGSSAFGLGTTAQALG